MYLNGVLEIALTNSISGRSAPNSMNIGCQDGGYFWNGRMQAIKAWTAALSAQEILAEMRVIRPIVAANLYGFWPCWPGSGERVRDYSGNGRNWTESGTITDEDPAPIGWGGHIIVLPYAAAGGVTVTPARAEGSGLAVAPSVVLGSVTVAPARSEGSGLAVAPTVVAGSMSITPAHAEGSGLAIAPTVLGGGVTVAPSRAQVLAWLIAPTVVKGSVSVAPAQAEGSGLAMAPTVVSNVVLTPTWAEGSGLAIAPTVTMSSMTVAPSWAQGLGQAITGAVLTGVVASPASASTEAAVGGVVLSSTTATPSYAMVLGRAAGPGAVASAKGQAVAPTVLGNVTFVTPAAAICTTEAIAPTYLVGAYPVEQLTLLSRWAALSAAPTLTLAERGGITNTVTITWSDGTEMLFEDLNFAAFGLPAGGLTVSARLRALSLAALDREL
jgi:hypothetical protein